MNDSSKSNLIRQGNWKQTSCPICSESQKITLLGNRTEYGVTRNFHFEFNFNDVVCEKCGFVFEHKIPDDDFLNSYYSDAHYCSSDITQIKPDFNEKNRLNIIKQFLKGGSKIFEIGANEGTFCNFLNKNGYITEGVDPINIDTTHVSKHFVNTKYAKIQKKIESDCVVSYYVLEHVKYPKDWILQITQTLKNFGILILEVPNFSSHPVESLNFEHLQHFTPIHLKLLLENLGFEILSCDELLPSRYFGFTIVARLISRNNSHSSKNHIFDPKISSNSKKIYAKYKKLIHENEEYYEFIINKVLKKFKHNKKHAQLFFWGANNHATHLNIILRKLAGFEGILIDSGKTKIGTYHLGFSNPITSPKSSIISNPLFVLCSPNFASEIENQILKMGFSKSSIIHGYR